MNPFLCANQGQGDAQTACSEKGTKFCSGCNLIVYCSKECQISHWTIHKLGCKSPLRKPSWKPAWELEQRRPAFIDSSNDNGPTPVTSHGGKRYLWGNMPAIDLLQLADNEGSNTTQDLHLLLAASGDPRNFIKTITCLPDEYQGHIHVDINDRDETVVARNLLIILIALNFPVETASDMILHVWYSAFLTESITQSIKDTILPIIQNVLAKGTLGATWTYHSTKLSAELDRKTWDLLLAYCQGNHTISFEDATRLRKSVTLGPSRQDYRDRAMFALPPSWRVAKAKFRADGILLPFGASSGDFKVPNPIFFHDRTLWPMPDSADPLHGWKLDEVLQEPHLAKADLYGLLYLHVRKYLVKFCERVCNLKLNVSFFCMDALDLPNRIEELDEERLYDRIELANIADRAYLGPIHTIGLYGPLLKHPAQNPEATLITLFLNASHEESNLKEQQENMAKSFETLQQFLPLNPAVASSRNRYSAEVLNFGNAHDLLLNNDPAFKRYMEAFKFEELGKAFGVEMKSRHTIIGKWPMKLPRRSTKRQFEMMYWSGHQGSERYVEWRKTR
ncbi:hypothetical protein TMatcc_007239 [Talaromyces marneffei ATCC 18224]|uniref:MYND-type domain-containing protein n=1 Tax=Talaromyces marneffei (strain ATCC 18224 / CBS 334.59 / QM 7333) TaxID=441960 RepID=B6QFC8_TALMQ|nr:uncharacterized protein EYB26_004217 [Talaromyces marneffei]EEA24163.1 conserved hypothetical protein [Talaromyces marneffei ATCC 18224]KAE8553323.1 hypothetical protein EYB25_004705 [Talaromyces marneffei]QGA16550.1 hypothetical protein EYB26_004217 [Talaromyces marneffei]